MELTRLKSIVPKNRAEDAYANIDERMLESVAAKIKDIRWFKVYNTAKQITGSVYMILDNNNVMSMIRNRINPKDKGHNPRYSLKIALQKFSHGKVYEVDSTGTFRDEAKLLAFAQNFVEEDGTETARLISDICGAIRAIYKANP